MLQVMLKMDTEKKSYVLDVMSKKARAENKSGISQNPARNSYDSKNTISIIDRLANKYVFGALSIPLLISGIYMSAGPVKKYASELASTVKSGIIQVLEDAGHSIDSIFENTAQTVVVEKQIKTIPVDPRILERHSIERILNDIPSYLESNESETTDMLSDKYLSRFNFPDKIKSNIVHADKVFNRHKDFIINMTNAYNVALHYFQGKLGAEHGEAHSRSPSGAIGHSQLFPDATIDGMKYTLENNITQGPLYDYAKKCIPLIKKDDALVSKINNIKSKLEIAKNEKNSDAIKSYENKLYELRIERAPIKKEKDEIIRTVLYNPLLNLEAGIAHEAFLIQTQPEWSLVSTAYQIGSGKLAALLHYHQYRETGNWHPKLAELNLYKDENNVDRISIVGTHDANIRNYIKKNNIDYFSIFENELVMNDFETKFKGKFDVPELYVNRVMQIAKHFKDEF